MPFFLLTGKQTSWKPHRSSSMPLLRYIYVYDPSASYIPNFNHLTSSGCAVWLLSDLVGEQKNRFLHVVAKIIF